MAGRLPLHWNEPPLRPEFCAQLVAGRSIPGRSSLPWHQAMVPAYRTAPASDPRAAAPGSSADAALGQSLAPTPERSGTPRARATEAWALFLAGRRAEAWRVLSAFDVEPGGEAAYLRAWAAGAAGAPEAADLLATFTAPAVPLACRAPALREAAFHLASRGDLGSGLVLLAALGKTLPEIPDFVFLWSVEAARRAGSPATADSLYRELLVLDPAPALVRAADLERARLFERTGATERARSLLLGLLASAPARQRPPLLLELAELEARSGDTSAAETYLRRLILRHPGSNQAAGLLEPDMGDGAARLRLSSGESARVLAAQGRLREAVLAITPASHPDLLRLRGDIHFGAGRFADAAADYEEAIARGGDPSVLRMELAKARGRGGEPARAREIYRRILADEPVAKPDPMLLYLIADAFQEESTRDRASADSAAAWFRLLVERHPSSALAGRALLRLAHMRFAGADWAGAEKLYREYLRTFRRAEDVREARYWLARAMIESGRTRAGRDLLVQLREQDRADYYGLLARSRLDASPRSALEGLPAPAPGEELVDLAWDPEPSRADTVLPAGAPEERALRRARALLLVGEVDAARREIGEAARRAAGNFSELRRIARWALAFDYPEATFRIGTAALQPSRLESAWAPLAYPRAFGAYVLAEAREHGLAPSLLWGVMRQESQFDPLAHSPAGAVGLLQLMPATARNEAERSGVQGFELGDLERPEANLHVGALHLRAMLQALEGQEAVAIAGYNAGLPLATRWLGFPEAGSAEAYVERIPFRETRHYVKQVIANRALYEGLYGTR